MELCKHNIVIETNIGCKLIHLENFEVVSIKIIIVLINTMKSMNLMSMDLRFLELVSLIG